MAVPKKRTGHSAQGHRRSNWKATKPAVTTCSNCGQPVLTHTVCSACGYYKGKAVSIKSSDHVEAAVAVKEEKTEE
ncbi:50S ribosomal protein L32 [bacterium]|nr:50S ribosomal protein L32 [bacterium]